MANAPFGDDSLVTLSGWGGQPRSSGRLVGAATVDQLAALVAGHWFVPRGLGRSYGDAAQLSGGTVAEVTGLQRLALDPVSGRVTAGGGTSLGDIVALAVPHGWFLPVSPGTRHVTVGGAIAADVHGKNHHRDGSFGSYVESLRLLTASGAVVEARRGDDVFVATVGGMGLTGVIVEASFSLTPVASAWMRVASVKARDLASVMERLAETDTDSRYSVAWVDLGSARARGRGLVMSGDHAGVDVLPARRRPRPLSYRPMRELPMPPVPGAGLIDGRTVSVFNSLWFSRGADSPSGDLEFLDTFFYPLDRARNWNRLYGRNGFLQYQFVVPSAAPEVLSGVAERLAASPTPVSLAVLKRLGQGSGGLLGFPMEGWTLSADMPLGDASLARLLDDCDRLVAKAGGRVYLAKDSRLRPEFVGEMYPDLGRFRQIKERLDPEERIRSDLSDRLRITG